MMRGTFANIRIRNRMLDNVEGGFTRYAPTGEERCRSTTQPWPTSMTARRSSSSPARNMAPAARATGRRRAPSCSASARSSPRASSASTARTWSAWASCRCSSTTAKTPSSLGLDGSEPFTIDGVADIQPRQDVEVQVTRDGRIEGELHRPLPHRYVQRARIFPLGRHPPLRAEEARRRVTRLEIAVEVAGWARRRADPARLSAALGRQDDGPVARLSGDERGRRRRFRDQRLVARRHSVGGAQRDMAGDWGDRIMEDLEAKAGSSTSAT